MSKDIPRKAELETMVQMTYEKSEIIKVKNPLIYRSAKQ